MPKTQEYLVKMGMGSLTYVGSLFVTGTTWAGTISPTFLPNLVQIGENLAVRPGSGLGPLPISQAPGLISVRQVGKEVRIFGTSFTDMSSLRGLQCVGGGLQVAYDQALTSFSGFEALKAVNYKDMYPDGAAIVISNTSATVPAAFAPLGRAANCGGPSPKLSLNVVTDGCPKPIKTWSGLCAYIASGTCPV